LLCKLKNVRHCFLIKGLTTVRREGVDEGQGRRKTIVSFGPSMELAPPSQNNAYK